ncbi:Elongation factor Tu C-terminal domain [Globisporangium polare]
MALSLKPKLSVVVLGHIDSGKSTTVGHLLYTVGCVSQREMDKLTRESADRGKASFKYAWVLDKSREERERGLSIDISLAKFETPKYVFTAVDVPGHRDFIKNAITGTSQADAALLVVAAGENEFNAGFEPTGQTRDHALLAFALGIKQMVVAVNKMDCDSVAYSEERFTAVKSQVRGYLNKVGFNTSAIPIVPISGWSGDNLLERSENMPWYDGPTLLDALDSLSVPMREPDKPLRVLIQNVYNIAGVGAVATGRVETGVLTPGTNVTFGPVGVTAEVSSIESYHQVLTEARPGDQVGFTLSGISAKDIARGCVMSDAKLDSVKSAIEFTAQLIILTTNGSSISVGYTPIVHCHTAHVACRLKQITEKIDRETGQVLELNPTSVKTGDACTVVLEPSKPMVVEAFQQYPALGRFVIRDGHFAVAVGIIKSVKKTEK